MLLHSMSILGIELLYQVVIIENFTLLTGLSKKRHLRALKI